MECAYYFDFCRLCHERNGSDALNQETVNQETQPAMQRESGLFLLVLPWCIAVAFGFSILITYSSLAGSGSVSPPFWPNDIELVDANEGHALLVFIHPKCPCTFATVSELERLVAEINPPCQIVFLLNCPKLQQSQWSRSALASRCNAFPGGRVILDFDGELATKFKAKNSGYCLLYLEGQLLFQGGVTTERGHEGQSLGRDALRQLLTGQKTTIRRTPVFGCELFHLGPKQPRETGCCKGTSI